ncbi:MAG: hypothetical protein LBD68_05890 [Zoogloeaceae bacterium]|jgi:hypothetical protein|nr:hypothetical protein [Zoogloeaceae bacterium]
MIVSAAVAVLLLFSGCGDAPPADPPRVDGSSRAAMLASLLKMEASLSHAEQTTLARAIEAASLAKATGREVIAALPPTARHPIRPFRVARELLKPDERLFPDDYQAALTRQALAGKSAEGIIELAFERSRMTLAEKREIIQKTESKQLREKQETLCAAAESAFSRLRLQDFRFYPYGGRQVLEYRFVNESPYDVREIMLEAQHSFPGEAAPRAQKNLAVNWPALHHAVHTYADMRALNPWIWEAEKTRVAWQPGAGVLTPGKTERYAAWAPDDFPLRDAPADSWVEMKVAGIAVSANDGWRDARWFMRIDWDTLPPQFRVQAIICRSSHGMLHVSERGVPADPSPEFSLDLPPSLLPFLLNK